MHISDWSSCVCSSDLLGGRYHFAAVQLHVIDRQVAEIADVPDFAGHAVAVGRRRLLGDHQLLRPQGDPHLAAQWLVAAGAGHDGAAGFRTLHDEMVALAPRDAASQDVHRSEERSVGEEWVSTCRYWWSRDH